MVVKRILRQREVFCCCSNGGVGLFILYLRVARVARIIYRLPEWFTHVALARINVYSHCDTLTWRCDRCVNGDDGEARSLRKL